MKSETVFKRAFNDALDMVRALGPGVRLPTEESLSDQLNVSRTTVRKVLSGLQDQGLIVGSGRHRMTGERQARATRFPESETVPMSAQVEAQFMDWMLRDDTRPGAAINELELARQFGVATTGIREFLNRFQRFGLIEKRAHGGWAFKGFTREFALELFEIREMFERRSAQAFARLPAEAPAWRTLEALRRSHVEILDEIDQRFHDFSRLDSNFHRLINAASPNRFIDGFSDIMTLIFHYHYQWNKRDERQRNEVALGEHLAYIDALQSRDLDRVDAACMAHLASARQTLIKSTRQ